MQENRSFSPHERVRSFAYAFRGIAILIRTQHNAWIHSFATLVVLLCGVYFRIERSEWLWLVVATGLVWVAEALNTGIELLGDALSREPHPLIGKAKDVAAAGVLLAAITAVVIGLLVFAPYVGNRQ